MSSPVDQLRRFNRAVTRHVGALEDRFMSRARPLGQARLLWEVGLEGAEVVVLRARLGLDSGQLSRMLRELERDRLVTVTASAGDARVRVVRLTRAGLAERTVLEEQSQARAEATIEALDEPEQVELVSAMRTVERLLLASAVELRQVDPTGSDAQRCLRAYVTELNRRAPQRGFDPRKGSTADPEEVTPPRGAFVVAYLYGTAVGCGAVKHHSGEVTDIKRMWVSETTRGLGMGRRILSHLEHLARERGSTEVRLETSDVLPEAVSLYRTSGYREVAAFNDEAFADRWFRKPIV